jgi:FAD/FMN-containing dehydrogenase
MLRRAHPDYEATRQRVIWNARVPDRFPEVIVSPRSPAEVVAAVNEARASGLQIAIRSGGHSWHASSLRRGGMLLDLGQLTELSVDPSTRTAVVGPAVTSRALMARLGAHGLAFPTGHCPTVAMGGYLLAGGRGWNWAEWGPACGHVEAIDVVTADGVERHASASDHPDLLWAARGSGPAFFGVVTRFYLRAQPTPASLAGGADVYPLELCDAVMDWVGRVRREWTGETRVSLGTSYEGVDIPLPVIAVGTTAFGPSDEATARIVRKLDECPVRGRALSSRRDWSTSFAALYDRRDRAYPEGRRWAADTLFSSLPPLPAVATLAGDIARAPSPESHILIAPLRAPMPPFTPPGAAVSIDGDLLVYAYATWADATQDRANLDWLEGTVRRLAPSIVGHYVGEADLTRWPVERCFAPASWRRLQELRDVYDPDRVFFEPMRPEQAAPTGFPAS